MLLDVHSLWQAAVRLATVLPVQVLRRLLELHCFQALVENPRIVETSVWVVGQLQLSKEALNPRGKRPLMAVGVRCFHPFLFLLGRLPEALFQRSNRLLDQERIEFVEAGELCIAPCELAEDHGRVFEVLHVVLDHDILDAGQVEAVLEGGDEEDLGF